MHEDKKIEIMVIQYNWLKQKHCRVFPLSYPQDFEILGWCPVGPVLPHGGGEYAFLVLVGNTSSDGVTLKMPYRVDVLHQPALHPTFSY